MSTALHSRASAYSSQRQHHHTLPPQQHTQNSMNIPRRQLGQHQQSRRPRSEPGASNYTNERFAAYLGKFASLERQEQRSEIGSGFSQQQTAKDKFRREARRQSDSFATKNRRQRISDYPTANNETPISRTVETPSSPRVSDLRRHFSQAGGTNNHETIGRQTEYSIPQNTFERAARSLSPFRAKSTNTLDGNKAMFKSKFFEAAARQIHATASSMEEMEAKDASVGQTRGGASSVSIGRTGSWRNNIPPIVASPKADVAKISTVAEPSPASPSRRVTSSYRVSSPKSHIPVSPHSKNNMLPRRHDLPTRGRMATTEQGKERHGRSPSPFIQQRMSAFSRDPHDRETSSSVPRNLGSNSDIVSFSKEQTNSSNSHSMNVTERLSSSEQDEMGEYKRDTPLNSTKQSNVAAFRHTKVSQEANVQSPVQRSTTVNSKELTKEKELPSVDERVNLDLLAKLNAIDRANPAEALMKIDTILREEGQKTQQGVETLNTVEFRNYENDDGSTVSSITNPVFPNTARDPNSLQFYNNAEDPNILLKLPDLQEPRAVISSNSFPSSLPNSRSKTNFVKEGEMNVKVETGGQVLGNTTKVKQDDSKVMKSWNDKLKSNGEFVRGHPEEKKEQETSKMRPKYTRVGSRRSHPWDDESQLNNAEGQDEGRKANFKAHAKKPVQEHRYFQKHQTSSSPVTAHHTLNRGSQSNSTNAFSNNRSNNARGTAVTMTPEQYENAKQKSDNFDAAWVSMSGSSTPADVDTSFDTTITGTSIPQSKHSIPEGDTGEGFSIEVALYDPRSDMNEKPRSRSRGFLQAFMRRQSNKKGATQSSQTVNSGSHGAGSHGSAGAKSLPTPKRPHAYSPAISPVSHPNAFPTHKQMGRMKDQNRSIQRSHSLPKENYESAEQFRTASMAQKYNRVMRLYDDE